MPEKLTQIELSKVQIPEGYKLIPDPDVIEQERKQSEIEELEAELANMIEPDIEELAEYGKAIHPYYITLKKLERI